MKRILTVALLGIGGAALVIGAYWYFEIRPRTLGIWNPHTSKPSGAKRLDERPGRRDFDLAYQLSGSVLAMAGNGRELIVGDRKGGTLRVRRDGKHLEAQVVPVLDPIHQQNVNLSAMTWNGREYVGLTTGAWFRKPGDVFTIHDATTLKIVSNRPAPDLLGCLAWDGTHYWAATRKHTADQDVPSSLYKLDREFNVVETFEAPGHGCQGMVWDGRHLWLADVFSDSITLVDPRESPPKLVHSYPTPLSYLSGIALFEKEIWVTEYGENQLHRLRPSLRTAWAGTREEPVLAAMVPAPAEERVAHDSGSNPFSKRPANDAELIDWSIELRGDALYGSWRIWFGDEVFVRREQPGIVTIPQFARYTLTVETPSGEKIEKQYDAAPGENAMNDVRLCDASASGEYEVLVHIHVQFVDANGTAQILNRSAIPLDVRR